MYAGGTEAVLDNRGFDRWAHSYDGDVRESAGGYPFAGYEELMDRLFARICKVPGARVLDLGCGTGELAGRLTAAGCSVCGVDFSREMLAEAARRAPGAEFIQRDFSKGLPEDCPDTFDFIVCTYAIHHLDAAQQARLLREGLYRLRPGGEIILGDVAFKTRRELELCREAAGEEWDDEENYPVAEELRRYFPALGFERVSFCAGILSLKAEPGPDIRRIFPGYETRPLREADAEAALALCAGNREYYEYMHSAPSAGALLGDMLALPPGRALSDKYFLGVRDGEGLLAIADLVAGYPDAETAWLGLFMLRAGAQKRGLGRKLAGELFAFLRAAGFARAGLAWVRENPLPGHFWPLLGFVPDGTERPGDGYTLITAYKAL